MADPFLGEIKIFAGNFAPRGWALCNGQVLPINQNAALFALLGTTFGGDSQTNFKLPDLRGRASLHSGSQIHLGTPGGQEGVVLTPAQLPTHSHTLMASSDVPDTVSPADKALAAPTRRTLYSSTADTTLAAQSITGGGGGQAHENRQPYLALNFIIALQGIFPSRN